MNTRLHVRKLWTMYVYMWLLLSMYICVHMCIYLLCGCILTMTLFVSYWYTGSCVVRMCNFTSIIVEWLWPLRMPICNYSYCTVHGIHFNFFWLYIVASVYLIKCLIVFIVNQFMVIKFTLIIYYRIRYQMCFMKLLKIEILTISLK